MAEIRIWPRKPTDRGGYICMPLKSDVPEGHNDWTLTTCPECGAACWQETYWKMMEALEQIKAADSSKAEKLRGAVRAAVDEMK